MAYHVLFLCTGNLARSIEEWDEFARAGAPQAKRRAFLKAFTELTSRIDLLLNVPLDTLDRRALEARLQEIGKTPAKA